MMIHYIVGIAVSLLLIIYCLNLLRFYIGLTNLSSDSNPRQFSVSVLIPARNEAGRIAECLDRLIRQNFPMDKLEIIVINDRSEDETESVVLDYCSRYSNIRLINIEANHKKGSSKKYAITMGIQKSNNDIIFTTDADCISSPNWINEMISHYDDDVGIVAGPVMIHPGTETNIYLKIQSLEFTSLVIAGMGSAGFGRPIIANGANLSYRRSVFFDVNGFEGIETLPSGDDDLFIQKVNAENMHKIVYTTEPDSIVYTNPVQSIKAFIHQRSRWASKGAHYNNKSLILYLVSVYLLYLYFIVSIPLAIVGCISPLLPIALFIIKLSFDSLLIFKGLTILNRNDLFKYLPLAEIFQVIYVVIAGFLGFIGVYRWKE